MFYIGIGLYKKPIIGLHIIANDIFFFFFCQTMDRALEELDSLLLQASRNDSGSSIDSMKAKVVTVLDALNG